MWVYLIIGAIVGVIAIAIILKILSKHFVAILVTDSIAAVGIIVSSFAMPRAESVETLKWGWVIAQGLFIFLFCVIFCAGFAFDEEEYEKKTRTTTPNLIFGGYTEEETTTMETRSVFWTVLGVCLGIAVGLVFFNYLFFHTHAIALGVVGCLALCLTVILLIKLLLARRRRRHYY